MVDATSPETVLSLLQINNTRKMSDGRAPVAGGREEACRQRGPVHQTFPRPWTDLLDLEDPLDATLEEEE